jgi:hypothetical protein
MRATISKKDSGDSRKHRRPKTFKSGKIVFSEKRCLVNCTVCDFSEGGAKLQTDLAVECPDSFELTLQDGSTYECTVVRRWANFLGVKFVNEKADRS